MEVVTHRVFVSEFLQKGNIALLHVVKRHRISAAVVVDATEKRIELVGVIDDHERIQITKAARRILERGVSNIAVGLLPHFEKSVSCVTSVGVIRQLWPTKRKGPVGQVIEVRHASVWIGLNERLRELRSRAGKQKLQILRL